MHITAASSFRAAVTALVVTAVAAACGTVPAASRSPEQDSRTRVVLLGTGTPNAEPDRSGPALAVVVGDRAYLVDAGPGVVRRAAAAAAAHGIDALRPSQLDLAFITHLHSDHTAGLPDLLLTPWVLGRERPLRLIGPTGLAAMARHVDEAWSADVEARLSGLEPANATGYESRVTEVDDGEVYRDGVVVVSAFTVPHGPFARCLGYRFETPDGVVVVSGDSGPFAAMAERARGAALLVHEAYATAGWERREPEWRAYHRAMHSSGAAVGRHAAAAGVGAVVLVHQLLWGATESELVREVASTYAGPVYYGRDLDVFEVGDGTAKRAPALHAVK